MENPLKSLLFALVFASCEPAVPTVSKEDKKVHEINYEHFEVIEYDQCEYVIFKDFAGANKGFGYMSHKGNCKNPIHFHNKPVGVDSSQLPPLK